MKKFLVLASILLVLTLILVACGGDDPKETTGETTADTTPVTDAPTEEPTEAPADTNEPAVTDEPVVTDDPVVTDEPVVTDKPVDTDAPVTDEPEDLPYVEPSAAGQIGISFDTFFTNGNMYFPEDGMAGDKLAAQDNLIVFKTGEICQSLAIRGWVGFSQAIESFGYYVDTYDFVWGDFFVATEDGVKAAGGEHASRFQIDVLLAGLSIGEHKVGFLAKLADGTVVLLRPELTVAVEKTAWKGSGVVTHQSFDQLYTGTGNAENGPENVFTPGASAEWNYIADFSGIAYADFNVDTLTYWGWIGATGDAVGQFGYQINGGKAVYDDAWQIDAEQPVVDAAAGSGATVASRMKIFIDISGLSGENTVTVLYKNAEATVVLCEFKLITPVKPTHYDNYNVPMENWAVSGHAPGLTSKDKEGHGPMVAAGGLDVGALLHQGAIGLGEIDLSKYSKVVLYVGMDNSDVTLGHHSKNANNRIMLVTADTNMTNSPAEETIIASIDYAPMGWALTAIEIDLTGVDYNGPVFVTYDTLPGTFLLVGSVEFIGGEYVEPVDPMKPVNVFDAQDISTIARPNGIASADIADGYLHVVPSNGDPSWYPFAQVDGGRYVAIRYRSSDATGANMQFFMASTGGAPSDDTSMLQQAIIVDGEWHLLIIDTQPLIDAGIYDGKFVSYFRFDPLEAGYVLDENGEPYKENDIWVKYPLPEGCSVDISFIGFFHCPEAAEKYEADKFGVSGGSETPDTPAPVEPLEINMSTVGISGSWSAPMDGAGLGLPAGTPVPALHYGSLDLGEIDLSKYSKVTITYSTPAGVINGQDMNAEYEATGKRVLLLNAPSAVQDGTYFEYLPANEAIITSAHYDMSSALGEIKTIEIDLSAVDYNGQTYLTFDARNANNEFGALAYLVYVIGVTFS